MDIDDNGLSKPKSQQAFALYQKNGQMIFDSSSFFKMHKGKMPLS